jgi:hypothetical protein
MLFVFALGFMLSATGPAAASEDPPIVRRTILGMTWETVPAQPCAGQPVALRFMLCECQVDLLDASYDSTRGVVVRLRANPSIVCATCNPDSAEVRVGALLAGMHSFNVRFDIDYVTAPPDSSWPTSPAHDVLTFSVGQTCPTPTGIPYLDRVIIGQPSPCEGCPSRVCPNDSIDVFLAGTFPDDCTRFGGITLYPSMLASPLPQPPTVGIQYETASCLGRPCMMQPQPWSARVRLPGLPGFSASLSGPSTLLPLNLAALPVDRMYQLPVVAHLQDLCLPDSLGTLIGSASYPFTVADSCTTSVPPPPLDRCFNVAWYDLGGGVAVGNPTRCTATWRPGGTTQLSLAVGSHAPIAGVQGALRLENAGALRVVDVTSLLPGWQVARSLGPDGGDRFIAFAGPGAAPIPGSIDGRPTSFLRVVVQHNDLLDVVTPDIVHLAALDLLVSDVNGIGIPGCPTPAIYPGTNVATLCRSARCDANADGHSDVRDLVVMVNCLNPPPNVRLACPDSSVLDCDRSGAFDLDDVFCCVRSMLGGGMPPDSTGGMRDAPEIVARFGVPQAAPDGVIDVPLYLGGMSAVAAARLDVAYPDARYELLEVTFADAPASWWTFHDATGGRARLAILDLAGLDAAGRPIALATGGETRAILRFRLRAGAAPGGELSVAAHDFAAADGVGLTTPNAAPRLALASGTSAIALSVARPNPFTGSTAFALTVPTAGAIDVAVFTANGRRVATLLRESAAAAGVYDLAWDGRQDAGGRAPSGVYFVRVVGASADASRKVLYLPGGVR